MTEEITSPAKSKWKRSPYLIVLAWGIIVSCIAMNLVDISNQYGILKPWRALSAPPSGVKSIIGGGTFTSLWVRSKDGKTYSILVDPINCRKNRKSSDCFVWKPIENDIPEISPRAKRSNNCETLQPGMFPLNPRGQLVECAYLEAFGFFGGAAYFALMKNGEVFYWQHYSYGTWSKESFIFSSFTIPVITAIIISLIYVILLAILYIAMTIGEFFSHSHHRPFASSREHFIVSHYIFPAIVAIIFICLLYATTHYFPPD